MRTSALFGSIFTALMLGSCGQSASEGPRDKAPARKEVNDPFVAVDAPGQAVHYTLGFADAAHHYLSVRGVFPMPPTSEVDLSLATWTPGSYLVREYARNIEDVRALDLRGHDLPVTKSSKNRWTVQTGGNETLVVEYKVYCRELSVRTNFVDIDYAILNGAPTFLRLVEDRVRPHEIVLDLPKGWQEAQTGLRRIERNHFRAQGYDELIDSPILAGRELSATTFKISDIPHHIVQLGDSTQWDSEEILADVQDLVKAEQHFWGVVPYESYHFLNVLLGGGGGLEHLDSTLMMASPFSTRTAERYRGWLGLVAHEYFHTWNVKRLRPKALGPFDYENENYTASLWIAEGITTYYADLLMKRAGLLDEDQYLTRLSEQIRSLQTTPGRAAQSLTRSSQDAWIKYYRRDENTANTAISYYTKGAVVAFLLDTRIRKATGSAKSLDDVMRAMYGRYSGEVGYTPEQFRDVASEIAGEDLADFFARAVDGREELDYQLALEFYGLTLSGSDASVTDAAATEAADEEDEPAAWLGAKMSGDLITSLERGTPAYAAGLNVDDEILAVDGYRMRGNLETLLGKFKEGQSVRLTVARHGRLREMPATLGKSPDKMWSLAIDLQRSQLAAERLKQWLAEYDL